MEIGSSLSYGIGHEALGLVWNEVYESVNRLVKPSVEVSVGESVSTPIINSRLNISIQIWK